MNVLVTGGTGYIGSITSVTLIEAGYQPIIFDNLSNSKPAVLDRIAQVSGQRPPFVQGDVRDRALLDRVLRDHNIEACIHFAALKSVDESTEQPLRYFDNNVAGSVNLLQALIQTRVQTFIFSSSATVYFANQAMPLTETAALGPSNPYGQSKLMIEQVMRDLASAEPAMSLTALRYFNPVGAHPSGQLGEDPTGIPNNLVPYIAQVAVGRRPFLRIWGDDYATPDGTGVRDYIHVMDLAAGHVAALNACHGKAGIRMLNLGTGRGYSVKEVLAAFSKACGKPIASQIMPRRAGDIGENWSNPTLANQTLGWRADRDIDEMCEDAWRWQRMNPNGYM